LISNRDFKPFSFCSTLYSSLTTVSSFSPTPSSTAAYTVVPAARSSTDNYEATPPYAWHFGRRSINVVSGSPASRPCCDEYPLRGRLRKRNGRSQRRSRHRLRRRRSPVVAAASIRIVRRVSQSPPNPRAFSRGSVSILITRELGMSPQELLEKTLSFGVV